MSAKVNVLGENRTIKRTLAMTLVQKQIYEWHLYMVSVRPVSIQKYQLSAPAYRPNYYIPDRLPPAEVGGCTFRIQRNTPPTHLRTIIMPFEERALGPS